MPSKPVPCEVAEAIRLRKSQYCRFAGTHKWTGFRDIFLPSIKATFHNPDGSIVVENNVPFSFGSRDTFIDFFASAFETQQTINSVAPGELEFAEDAAGDEYEVKAVWPVTYYAGSRELVGRWSGIGGGYYFETWKRVDGEWFMASLRFERWYWKVTGVDG
ncbi:uncharacterized protein BDW70DRAFT_169825 [Aspergillus foveolatus]|uniref:uncharacterized protein n=1 Tax=Aspergillus foveolatus TaxID=210207 RepID=UPI003CCD678D